MRRLAAMTMCLTLALLLTSATMEAQVRGTSASVTSSAPTGGHRTMVVPRGVPASVTSLGPQGFHAPRFPTDPQPFPTVIGGQPRGDLLFHGRFRDGRFRDRRRFAFPVAFPVYVPYAQPIIYVEQPTPVVVVQQPGPTVMERGYVPERPAPPESEPAPPARVYEDPPDQIATTLIFKDGRELEVFNYAIVGDVLINLNGNGPRRIKLADLDLEATIRVNDERGVLFKVPGRRS